MDDKKVKYVPLFQRSFRDAITLARTSRDQALIYYRKDGDRAVYDATSGLQEFHGFSVGSIIIRGRHLTGKDIPDNFKISLPDDDRRIEADGFVFSYKTYTLAVKMFTYHGIDTETGWDVCP